jgi:AcrR family transcriptional regulator
VARAGLSRDVVVAIGTALLESEPHAPLTLARVAAHAGVAVPSLYKHIGSLDELRDAVAAVGVTRIADAVADAVAGSTGAEAFRAAGRAIRAEALAHPGLYLAGQPAPGRDASAELHAAGERAVAEVTAVVRQAGLSAAREVDAVRIVRAAVHGFVVLEAAGGFGLPDDVDVSFERLLDTVWAGLGTL